MSATAATFATTTAACTLQHSKSSIVDADTACNKGMVAFNCQVVDRASRQFLPKCAVVG